MWLPWLHHYKKALVGPTGYRISARRSERLTRRRTLSWRFGCALAVWRQKSDELLKKKLTAAARAAVEEDGADVLGARIDHERHQAHDHLHQVLHVPVINPGPVGIKMAETLVRLSLAHSKVAFPLPPLSYGREVQHRSWRTHGSATDLRIAKTCEAHLSYRWSVDVVIIGAGIIGAAQSLSSSVGADTGRLNFSKCSQWPATGRQGTHARSCDFTTRRATVWRCHTRAAFTGKTTGRATLALPTSAGQLGIANAGRISIKSRTGQFQKAVRHFDEWVFSYDDGDVAESPRSTGAALRRS